MAGLSCHLRWRQAKRTRDVAVPATNGGKECVGILGSSNHSFNTCIATTGLVFLFDVRTSLFDS